MVRVKILLVLVLGLSLFSIFPVKSAYSDEIQFRVNFPREGERTVIGLKCNGPHFRTSGCHGIFDLPPGQFTDFYSAEINFFSPFGTWECTVHADPICLSFPSQGGHFLSRGEVSARSSHNNDRKNKGRHPVRFFD